MIRLTQVCLLVFLATLGFYLYQLHKGADYGLAFLMMGATGCLYLLFAFEKRFSGLKASPTRPSNKIKPKRVEPACTVNKHLSERRQMPSVPPIKIECRR